MGAKQTKRPQEDKRTRFAQEYAKDFNATQAAIRSGYAEKSAHVTGSRLLSDAKVQAMIQELHARAAVKAGITVERTIQEIARNAYGDTRALYRDDGTLKSPKEWDDDTQSMIASIESNEVRLGSGDSDDDEEKDGA